MNALIDVPLNIEKIKNIFLDVQQETIHQPDIPLLINYLESADAEFRSIAFEAASAAIAVQDFADDYALRRWNIFKQYSSGHLTQFHIGLGWAASQLRLADFSFLNLFTPLLQARIVDGCGYYDGMARQRQSITTKIIPEHFQNNFLPAYDQGIGRSLWYLCNGDVSKVPGLIESFPVHRHARLWTGIGVACAYVGGCDEVTLNTLNTLSAQFKRQLATGAALAARSRISANALSDGTQLACALWCKMSMEDAALLATKAEIVINTNIVDAYRQWLAEIEKNFI